ncbi:MAG: prepilin peptidase, partial [bacterium]
PLVWAGLIANYFELFTTLDSALIGAVVGYLGFWIVYHAHHKMTGREGLGYGDFKLLAALGAWLGWEMLPMIVLVASISGTVLSLAMMAFRGLNTRTPVSFGPFLAFGGWLALLWGQEITSGYLQLFNF